MVLKSLALVEYSTWISHVCMIIIGQNTLVTSRLFILQWSDPKFNIKSLELVWMDVIWEETIMCVGINILLDPHHLGRTLIITLSACGTNSYKNMHYFAKSQNEWGLKLLLSETIFMNTWSFIIHFKRKIVHALRCIEAWGWHFENHYGWWSNNNFKHCKMIR